MGTSVPTTVFVVNNGNGGQIDSVWGEQSEAQAQADKLNVNDAQTASPVWSVTSVPYRC